MVGPVSLGAFLLPGMDLYGAWWPRTIFDSGVVISTEFSRHQWHMCLYATTDIFCIRWEIREI